MDDIKLLKKRLEREIKARKNSEKILESKALELFNVNQELKKVNDNLETEIKNKTEAYINKEKQYRRLVESASDIIYNVDTEGYFTYSNPIGLNTLGLSEKEFIGKHFLDFVREDYQEKIMEFYSKALTDNLEETYFEFPLKKVKDKQIWLGQKATTFTNENGPKLISVIARDITKQKLFENELIRIKRELEASEIKYRSIIENLELGLLEVNTNGIIVSANSPFCEMLGYKKEDLLGQKTDVFMPQHKTIDALSGSHNPYDLNEKSPVYESMVLKKNGSTLWNIISGSPFFDINGNILGYIGIHYDISPIKKLQEELIKSKEISEMTQNTQKEFLSSIGHQIKTPLNAIIGMIHILNDSDLNEQQSNLLKEVIDSTEILKSVVSNLLDITKIESGRVNVNNQLIDINELLYTLQNEFKIKADQYNAKLQLYIDSSIKHYLMGDKILLYQILYNLVNNAINSSENALIKISADVKNQSHESLTLRFVVEDNGKGIKKELLPSIFDEYKIKNLDPYNPHTGIGLGLSITKKLIALLGGEIKVKSKEGQGSIFWFDLTFVKTKELIENTVTHPEQKNIEFIHPILIVEDNTLNQKYLIKLLDKYNLSYEIAQNGKEGYEKTMANTYCLILMDLQMPVMDGFEATRKIRASENPNHQKIPIIALSASTLLTMKEDVLKVGMNDYLAKPFTPDQLFNILMKYSSFCEMREGTKDITKNSFSGKLDKNYLDLLYGDDFDYAYEMFDIFIENVPEQIELLKSFMKSTNHEQVKKVAHKIKPTFSMVGLTAYQQVCQDIEKAAESGKISYFSFLEKFEFFQEDLKIVKEEMQHLKTLIN